MNNHTYCTHNKKNNLKNIQKNVETVLNHVLFGKSTPPASAIKPKINIPKAAAKEPFLLNALFNSHMSLLDWQKKPSMVKFYFMTDDDTKDMRAYENDIHVFRAEKYHALKSHLQSMLLEELNTICSLSGYMYQIVHKKEDADILVGQVKNTRTDMLAWVSWPKGTSQKRQCHLYLDGDKIKNINIKSHMRHTMRHELNHALFGTAHPNDYTAVPFEYGPKFIGKDMTHDDHMKQTEMSYIRDALNPASIPMTPMPYDHLLYHSKKVTSTLLPASIDYKTLTPPNIHGLYCLKNNNPNAVLDMKNQTKTPIYLNFAERFGSSGIVEEIIDTSTDANPAPHLYRNIVFDFLTSFRGYEGSDQQADLVKIDRYFNRIDTKGGNDMIWIEGTYGTLKTHILPGKGDDTIMIHRNTQKGHFIIDDMDGHNALVINDTRKNWAMETQKNGDLILANKKTMTIIQIKNHLIHPKEKSLQMHFTWDDTTHLEDYLLYEFAAIDKAEVIMHDFTELRVQNMEQDLLSMIKNTLKTTPMTHFLINQRNLSNHKNIWLSMDGIEMDYIKNKYFKFPMTKLPNIKTHIKYGSSPNHTLVDLTFFNGDQVVQKIFLDHSLRKNEEPFIFNDKKFVRPQKFYTDARSKSTYSIASHIKLADKEGDPVRTIKLRLLKETQGSLFYHKIDKTLCDVDWSKPVDISGIVKQEKSVVKIKPHKDYFLTPTEMRFLHYFAKPNPENIRLELSATDRLDKNAKFTWSNRITIPVVNMPPMLHANSIEEIVPSGRLQAVGTILSVRDMNNDDLIFSLQWKRKQVQSPIKSDIQGVIDIPPPECGNIVNDKNGISLTKVNKPQMNKQPLKNDLTSLSPLSWHYGKKDSAVIDKKALKENIIYYFQGKDLEKIFFDADMNRNITLTVQATEVTPGLKKPLSSKPCHIDFIATDKGILGYLGMTMGSNGALVTDVIVDIPTGRISGKDFIDLVFKHGAKSFLSKGYMMSISDTTDGKADLYYQSVRITKGRTIHINNEADLKNISLVFPRNKKITDTLSISLYQKHDSPIHKDINISNYDFTKG